MSDRINITVILKSNILNEGICNNWFSSLLQFKAEKMNCKKLTKGKFVNMDINKLQNEMKSELDEDISSIIIKGGKNSVSLNKGSINKGVTSLACILEKEIFDKNKSDIIEVVNNFMNSNGIVAYMCSLDDSFWQDNEQVEMYNMMGRSLEGVKTKKNKGNESKEVVDIEFNPGHSHRPNGIWFGSCWMMWYGREYFKYIPMEVLANFNNCYENIINSKDCVRITLYENPWDYDKKENRDIQWDFRRSIGVDEVARVLENNDKSNTNIDATIEITEGIFEHNGVRLIKYYYDIEGKLIEKSKAIEVKIYELGEKGELLWSESEKINQ